MIRTIVAGLVLMLALLATACSAAATPAPPLVAAHIAPAVSAEGAPAASSDLVRLVLLPDQSEARYRVREQLAGVSLPSDAVGATKAFTGTIVGRLDGTIVSDQSMFQVDLRQLKSDESLRDNYIGRSVLETNRFPYATFVPTSAPGLPLTLPSSGDLAFTLVGNLTIRDVTKPVTWDVTGKVVGNTATGQASTAFTFEDFNLTQPHVSRVLSIVDSIRLELDLTLQRE
jgi:polyisoprenoid-binding protein YceI